MHEELQIVLFRMLLCPTDDELLGVVVQIALMEGRGVHGVEQLVQLRELDLDESGHEGRFRESNDEVRSILRSKTAKDEMRNDE
jgi:hypothetical protein